MGILRAWILEVGQGKYNRGLHKNSGVVGNHCEGVYSSQENPPPNAGSANSEVLGATLASCVPFPIK